MSVAINRRKRPSKLFGWATALIGKKKPLICHYWLQKNIFSSSHAASCCRGFLAGYWDSSAPSFSAFEISHKTYPLHGITPSLLSPQHMDPLLWALLMSTKDHLPSLIGDFYFLSLEVSTWGWNPLCWQCWSGLSFGWAADKLIRTALFSLEILSWACWEA